MVEIATACDETLYETDFYTWTHRQAALMRAGRLAEADLPNLIEEIESLGRAQHHALRSSYRLVLLHLLKMRCQPERRTASWTATTARERNNIEDGLADNPGLRPRRADAFAAAYAGAQREAAAETTLPPRTFPAVCPFSLAQVEDHDFWPEEAP